MAHRCSISRQTGTSPWAFWKLTFSVVDGRIPKHLNYNLVKMLIENMIESKVYYPSTTFHVVLCCIPFAILLSFCLKTALVCSCPSNNSVSDIKPVSELSPISFSLSTWHESCLARSKCQTSKLMEINL